MKVKSRPDDFQVEELPSVRPGKTGRFRFYRLTKEGLGTPEALEIIRRRWNLPASAVAHGGLKDKHAQTIQYLTIAGGPDAPLADRNFQLEPIGCLNAPYGPEGFRGNRFTIRLRDLPKEKADQIRAALDATVREGVPNYFDDQRFGSVGVSGEFIIHAWMKDDYEKALRLALAEPYPFDRPNIRREKDLLNGHWCDWPTLKAQLDKGNTRSVVTYLCDHPTDFRGAFIRLRRDMRRIYVSAFQSMLFNDMLEAWIRQTLRPEQLWSVKSKTGPRPFWHSLSEDESKRLAAARLPLPCSRNQKPEEPALAAAADQVMEKWGLQWHGLRVKKMEDVFFGKGERAATLRPNVGNCTIQPDDLNPGRRMARLAFELPRGSYATLVIKRLQASVGERLVEEPEPELPEGFGEEG
jgi:tRNA pseudouridine13 synthase